MLEGYELDAVHGKYIPKTPDAQGRVSCEQRGLLLGKVASTEAGMHAEWLRWLWSTDEVLATPEEALDAVESPADAASARADAADARAGAADARAERLAAELAALKASRRDS